MNNSLIFKFFFSFAGFIFCSGPVRLNGQEVAHKIDSLKQVLASVRTDTDRVNTLIAISDAFPWTDSVNKARYAKEALEIAEQIKWSKGIITASRNLSTICMDCTGNYLDAVAYAENAAAVAKKVGDRTNQAYALNQIGNHYMQLSQYGRALEYYRQVLALKADPNLELGVLTNMGVAYTNLADYARALACYDSSLRQLDVLIRASKYSDQNDTLQMAVLYQNMGDIYREIEDLDKARINYDLVLKLSRQTKNKYLEVNALKGIASTYNDAMGNEKAIEYYNLALETCREITILLHKTKEETHIYNQLGAVYLERGDIKNAMAYAQKSLQQVEANNYQDLLPENYLNMGKIYTKLKDHAKAIDYLKKAIDHCTRSGILSLQKDALVALSDAYEQSGQPALALDAYKQYKAIGDSLYNMRRYNDITRIGLKYEYDTKQFADSVKQAGSYQLKMQKQRVFTYSGFAGLVVALLLSFFIYRNYAHQKKANILISKAKDAVDEEKEKSDALLLNILPGDVAMELKQHGDVQPKMFDNVTVLFTDFVNFTVAGDRLTPQQLVAELYNCFKAFDVIISKYNIEKIKTVGDAYLAVSGLPRPNPNHAEDIVKAALEIRDFMVERRKQFPDNTFEIRLGINSGPVVAGIVGVKKFAYDIWGDTVNVAARMEQYSQEGKVNISEKTHALVKDKFTCTDRGILNVKNKGHMSMYFVETLSH